MDPSVLRPEEVELISRHGSFVKAMGSERATIAPDKTVIDDLNLDEMQS